MEHAFPIGKGDVQYHLESIRWWFRILYTLENERLAHKVMDIDGSGDFPLQK